MSCNSSGCNSNNCHKNDEDEEQQPQNTMPSSPLTYSSNGQQNLCIKCKTNHPISSISSSSSSIGSNSDETRFCGYCFRSNIYGKFRLALTSHAMVTPSDNVLVAFSGGPSSRVALQFVHDMQLRAQKNFEASKDKSLPVFGVGVAFIDESAVNQVPSDEVNAAIREMDLVLANLAPPMKQLHVVPIENVYSRDSVDGKEKLMKVLNDVDDITGKEDLLLHLRMLALQKVASENGYNRLVLGSCTSRIACHVLAATVKGKGYSLSADIQYVDARWEVPIVLPLRDCTVQELNIICRIDGLKTMELLTGHPTGINGLISSFVTLLQEENPSRESTIVRTAGKLTPFQFNRIPEINDCNVPLATRRRQKRFNLKPVESMSSELFCPICNSPLSDSELLDISSCRSSQSSNFHAACCSSCKFQILPKDPSLLEHFCWSLPQQLVARSKHESGDNLNMLREQIQDCLLSDGED